MVLNTFPILWLVVPPFEGSIPFTRPIDFEKIGWTLSWTFFDEYNNKTE